jgi:transcriptional regulator with GAF, ATPase, and Fis domain
VTSTPTEELAETFVELADAVVDELDPADFLNLLADRSVRLLDVPAVGVLLVDLDGGARTTGASGTGASLLAQFEDGPGPACYGAGEPVAVPDLTRSTLRWPQFAPAATAAGFASTHTVPLRLRADVIGALTLLRTVPGEVDKGTERIAQAIADISTIALLRLRTLRRQTDLTKQLQHALTSRVVIEQAKGVTGERLGLGMEAAFHALRGYARSNNLRIAELAASVVDGSFDTADLTT